MMEWFNILRARLRALFRRESVLQDIEEELRTHVEMVTEENLKRGLPPDEARAAALKSFGNLGRNTELGYDIRGGGWLEDFWQDLRYGVRMLIKHPSFTAIAIFTLSLGLGANTAIFSVVNGVLLRPLPYKEPQRLVRVYSEFPAMNLRKFRISPPEFLDIQREAKSWESIGAWSPGVVNFSSTGEPIPATSTRVTRSLIDTLGAQPMLGRNFMAEEEKPNGPNAAIISHGLWQRAFGGQANIVGQQVRVNAAPRTIVGVMPPGYVFPPGSNEPTDVWLPFQFDPANPSNRGDHFLSLIGRLKPGVTIEQARAEMDALEGGWKSENRAQHLLNPQDHPILMFPLHEDVVGAARRAVLMLLGAVAFLLLIACANVASLLLARAEARQREFAVRLALGAGRGRMLRQFLTEGFILVVLGAVCGVGLAQLGLKTIMAVAPDSVPRTGEIKLDLAVLAFMLGISILAVFIFALTPMAQLREGNLAHWLHGASLRTTGASSHLLRRVLVVTEIALAVVLVVGSGLMIRAFWKLRQVDLGFNQFNALSFTLLLPPNAYPVPEHLRFSQTLLERLSALPGVTAAAMSIGRELPPLRPSDAGDIRIEGFQPTSNGPLQIVNYRNIVSADYFKTLDIRLVEGRLFEPADQGENAQRVAVINQAMARRFWQGSPIGRRVDLQLSSQTNWFTIVGVVEDTKNMGVDKPAGTELYQLDRQVVPLLRVIFRQSYVVRTAGDPSLAAAAVRAAVREVDPALPVFDMQPMSDTVADALARPRFLALLLGAFSAIALALAAVGIYGVMAYSVSQRTQEIGVRMALGARSSDVLKMVLSQGAKLAGLGISLGLLGAFALTRVMSTLLFEVSVTDPVTFAVVVPLLAVVALLACYIPARRATKVDPMIALRGE
jgi:putative ABC transport system permease protein